MVCSAQTVSEPSALGRTNVSRLRDGVRLPVLSSSIRTIPSAPASHRICWPSSNSKCYSVVCAS